MHFNEKPATMLDDTRTYFDHVIANSDPFTEDPYADNLSWQQKVAALKGLIGKLKLEEGRALEVGCGHGYLQDVVARYTGIDVAFSSGLFVQKPFTVASALTLPFPDNTFDLAWSIWVLEHIEQPERMLAEMRRVVKPGGAIFLCAGFGVDSWVSQGLHKRPFGELSWSQALIKSTIPVRGSKVYKIATTLPFRFYDLTRNLFSGQASSLRYGRLQPNYEHYWDYDADACVSLDAYNVALYFLSRGDKAFYSGGLFRSLLQRSQPQAYIVKK